MAMICLRQECRAWYADGELLESIFILLGLRTYRHLSMFLILMLLIFLTIKF